MAHLAPDRLARLVRAAEAAGLGFPDRRRLLLHGLPAALVALLPVNPVPRLQLLSDLQRLNEAPALPAGPLPLGVWLDNACLLVDDDPAAPPIIEARGWLRPPPWPGR